MNTPQADDVMTELDKLTKVFSDADYDALERILYLRAAVLGWTGDPLQQPPDQVLAAARCVIKEKAERIMQIDPKSWREGPGPTV